MFSTPLGPRITVVGGEGTVTSVALTADPIFSVSGSPIVTAGTLDFQLISQTQNKLLASPDGIAGIPSFRALVNGDLPADVLLRTLADAKGDILAASAADVIARLAVGPDGQVLTADSTQTLGIKWDTIPSGVTDFLSLTDTPASYVGQASKIVAVNAGETALEFIAGGGGGSSTFIGLTDVPATFTGQANKTVKVNAGETALEFVTVSSGSGDVTGPASSVDNELVRFNSTTGKIIKQETTAADRITLSTGILSRNAFQTLELVAGSGTPNRVAVRGSSGSLPAMVYARNGSNSTDLAFGVGNAGTDAWEVFRLDNTGRTIFNHTARVTDSATTTPYVQFHNKSFQLVESSTIASYRWSADTGSSLFEFLKSRNNTIGSHTVVNSGDQLGRILFKGSDGSNFRDAAEIRAEVDGTPGASDMPGRILFLTTPDGSATLAETMRLTNTSRLIVGHTSDTALDVSSSQFPQIANVGTTVGTASIAVAHYAANNTTGIFAGFKSRNTVKGSHTVIQSGDLCATFAGYGSDGSAWAQAARILIAADAAPSAGIVPGRIRLETADSAGTMTERVRIDSAGLITLAQGQIKFPAAQNASTDANTLDDYEEGTWTPTITFGGASVGITYSRQVGWYQKVGKAVTVGCGLGLSAKGSSVGTALLNGGPFTSENTANQFTAAALNGNNYNTATVNALGSNIASNDTAFSMVNVGAGVQTNLTDTDFTNSSTAQLGCTYRTAS